MFRYFESLVKSFWARLELVMGLHTESIHNYARKSTPLIDTRPYYVCLFFDAYFKYL